MNENMESFRSPGEVEHENQVKKIRSYLEAASGTWMFSDTTADCRLGNWAEHGHENRVETLRSD